MKIITAASLIAILFISSIQCQTSEKIEDQISSAEVLEGSKAESSGDGSSEKLIQGDEDDDEPSKSSMIPNTNNTIAKIVEAVASNMTANIMPSVKEVKIPMDLGAVLETVSQQMFKPEDDIPDGSKWVQSVPRKNKRLYAFSNESSRLEALNKPCWYDQESLPSNQSDWIWISSAFYDLMNDFVILDTNNTACRKHSEIYLQHLKNFTYWAMKMRDSSVLSPTGLLDGNFWQLGNYDECVGMYITKPDFRIIGKYCLPQLTFRPTRQYYPDYYREHTDADYYEQDADANAYDFFRPSIDPAKVPRNELHWAICIPHTCTTADLQTTLQKSFNELSKKYPLEFEVKVDENKCYDDTEREYTTGFFVFVAFFGLICALVAFSTIYDVFVLRSNYWTVNETLKQWTLPFSAVENIRKLCHHSKSPEDLQFSTVHMLKTICISQVVIGHRVLIFLGNVLLNPQFTEIRVKNPLWGYFNNGPIIVDSFFVIGGFLTFYYLFLELDERKGKINFLVIYIYRILRITPVYMVIIAFYIHVLPYLGEGPLWETFVMRESNRCRENWWTNLLYINNYVNTENQCMLQGWYLACDMHFFIVGTIICWIVWKWRKSGYPLLVFLMVLSIVYPPYEVYMGQYWSHFRTYISNMADPVSERFFQDIYVKSHLRAFPYIFGMFCGLLYIDLKKSDWILPFWYKWGLVGVFCITGQLPFIGSGLFYVPGRPYNAWENAIFFSLQRLMWTPIIGFIIVVHGLYGFEMGSKFANLRFFVPIGRLTFCCFLVHVIFQMMDIGSMRSPNFMSYTNIVFGIFQDLGLTATAGLVLNILIESPLDRFQKFFVKKLLRGQKLPSMLAKKENGSKSESNVIKPEPSHLSGNLNMAFEQSSADKTKNNV